MVGGWGRVVLTACCVEEQIKNKHRRSRFTCMAVLHPQGVILRSEWLARHQLRAHPHFIGSSNFEPGKSAFAYYRLLHIVERLPHLFCIVFFVAFFPRSPLYDEIPSLSPSESQLV